jgi:hypothetical protein
MQLIPIRASDHEEIDIDRRGASFPGYTSRPRAKDRSCLDPTQPAQFLPEHLCGTKDDDDESRNGR